MQVVTAFESSTPEQELAKTSEEKFDYSQVDGALRNDRTVAENVFARCAKHHFKKLVGDSVKMLTAEDPTPKPMWFASVSVILFYDGVLPTQSLGELVEALAASVLKIRGEQEIVLVEPLGTSISEVSPKTFKFSLKQKWGLDGKR